jgi:hypothetical protein
MQTVQINKRVANSINYGNIPEDSWFVAKFQDYDGLFFKPLHHSNTGLIFFRNGVGETVTWDRRSTDNMVIGFYQPVKVTITAEK